MMAVSFDYTGELDSCKVRLQKLKEKLKLRAMLRRGEFSGQQDQDHSKALHTPGGVEIADVDQASADLLPQLIARYLLGQEINLPLDSQALQNKVKPLIGRRLFQGAAFGKLMRLVCASEDTVWCLRLETMSCVIQNYCSWLSSTL